MWKRILAINLLLLIGATEVHALIFGSSNFPPLFNYPNHSCYKPNKPYKPYSFSNEYDIDRYNTEVELYNSNLKLYIACIKSYLENAKNDIERIREKITETIEEANNP